MKSTTAKKTVSARVRLTEDELKLFKFVASAQGISLSEFIRRSGVQYAETCTEHNELLEITSGSPGNAQKSFHQLFSDLNNAVAHTVRESHGDLAKRMEDLMRWFEVFVYVYLYHTDPVPPEAKERAKLSAINRKAKILEMIQKRDSS